MLEDSFDFEDLYIKYKFPLREEAGNFNETHLFEYNIKH